METRRPIIGGLKLGHYRKHQKDNINKLLKCVPYLRRELCIHEQRNGKDPKLINSRK